MKDKIITVIKKNTHLQPLRTTESLTFTATYLRYSRWGIHLSWHERREWKGQSYEKEMVNYEVLKLQKRTSKLLQPFIWVSHILNKTAIIKFPFCQAQLSHYGMSYMTTWWRHSWNLKQVLVFLEGPGGNYISNNCKHRAHSCVDEFYSKIPLTNCFNTSTNRQIHQPNRFTHIHQ